jgi:pimeloyl-ACP methyl ester carboxylesterase
MRTFGSEVVLCLMGVVVVVGCAGQGTQDEELSVGVQREALELNRACNDTLESIYAQPGNLPRYDSSRRGDIVRCSAGRTIPLQEVTSNLQIRGFQDIPARSAVQLLRITYRTERLARRADVSSAIVLLPAQRTRLTAEGIEVADNADMIETEAARRGGAKPLIVFGHGTIPYGPSCAYSRADPGSDTVDRELGALVAFATQGYPVIMPDYPGFVAGSDVAGYMLSEEEAHALLDATRAMRKLLRNAPERVAMVGHSQGGHAVLSAQALARSYGLSGQLSGVVALAPFWAVGRTFGAIFAPELGYTTELNGPELSFAIEYFYTHAELYDGRGRGAQLFQPQVRDALAGFVSSCNWYEPIPPVFGATSADFLQPDFYAAVTACGASGGAACSGGLAGTWESRFRADRPRLDTSGAPVLMWGAKADLVIQPALTKCAIDKIASDLPPNSRPAAFKFCGDSAADHESLIGNQLGWITRWIEARARGGAEPAACPGEQALQSEGPLMCLTPPGNSD